MVVTVSEMHFLTEFDRRCITFYDLGPEVILFVRSKLLSSARVEKEANSTQILDNRRVTVLKTFLN